jgi:3-hydroxyacyl-CoA dehydrogenase
MVDRIMQIKKITVVGAGTMGAQISVHIAKYGYDVTLYARHPERFQKTLRDLRSFLSGSEKIPAPVLEEWLIGVKKVRIYKDLKEALQEADLVVEAVSENLELKRKMFTLIDSLAPRDAILSTTSSLIPISQIEKGTQRRDRCLNLHFYQPPLLIRLVDIMGGTQTSADVMKAAVEFIQSIGCIPLVVKKESLGFGFVGVLHSIYRHTLSLWAGGYMDYKDIDRAWMIFTQMLQGPFGIMDTIGLDVVFDALMVYYNESKLPKDYPPQALKDMIDRRELGRKTGKGFYTYPQPEYTSPDFLRK